MDTLTWIVVAGFVLVCMQLYGISDTLSGIADDLHQLAKEARLGRGT